MNKVFKKIKGFFIVTNPAASLVPHPNAPGIDKLIALDSTCRVRAEVAKAGFALNILLHDPEPEVRCEVAKRGYGLDILVDDKDGFVRTEARLAKLKQLVSERKRLHDIN
jgi:hypothetical protein